MKLPSIIKTPKYQRFHIEPRYYDPVKEEIEQRTADIRRELKLDSGKSKASEQSASSRIRGSFVMKRAKAKSVNMMQIVILLLLVGGLVGYWFFGNIALYVFLMVSSLLLYLKVKGKL
ncbi:hypothetical protein E1176_15195 [Fulvivirga sp. RKSG066]|nr:hypothetical protein [Fulvivirga aurantia]